jgi:two-component sensor histidine kinase
MTITLSKEPEMLFKLCVRDYGRGFSNLEVFREGTTLGSRLVVSLVNQLGGQLKAYNDGGAVVEIWCQKTASP